MAVALRSLFRGVAETHDSVLTSLSFTGDEVKELQNSFRLVGDLPTNITQAFTRFIQYNENSPLGERFSLTGRQFHVSLLTGLMNSTYNVKEMEAFLTKSCLFYLKKNNYEFSAKSAELVEEMYTTLRSGIESFNAASFEAENSKGGPLHVLQTIASNENKFEITYMVTNVRITYAKRIAAHLAKNLTNDQRTAANDLLEKLLPQIRSDLKSKFGAANTSAAGLRTETQAIIDAKVSSIMDQIQPVAVNRTPPRLNQAEAMSAIVPGNRRVNDASAASSPVSPSSPNTPHRPTITETQRETMRGALDNHESLGQTPYPNSESAAAANGTGTSTPDNPGASPDRNNNSFFSPETPGSGNPTSTPSTGNNSFTSANTSLQSPDVRGLQPGLELQVNEAGNMSVASVHNSEQAPRNPETVLRFGDGDTSTNSVLQQDLESVLQNPVNPNASSVIPDEQVVPSESGTASDAVVPNQNTSNPPIGGSSGSSSTGNGSDFGNAIDPVDISGTSATSQVTAADELLQNLAAGGAHRTGHVVQPIPDGAVPGAVENTYRRIVPEDSDSDSISSGGSAARAEAQYLLREYRIHQLGENGRRLDEAELINEAGIAPVGRERNAAAVAGTVLGFGILAGISAASGGGGGGGDGGDGDGEEPEDPPPLDDNEQNEILREYFYSLGATGVAYWILALLSQTQAPNEVIWNTLNNWQANGGLTIWQAAIVSELYWAADYLTDNPELRALVRRAVINSDAIVYRPVLFVNNQWTDEQLMAFPLMSREMVEIGFGRVLTEVQVDSYLASGGQIFPDTLPLEKNGRANFITFDVLTEDRTTTVFSSLGADQGDVLIISIGANQRLALTEANNRLLNPFTTEPITTNEWLRVATNEEFQQIVTLYNAFSVIRFDLETTNDLVEKYNRHNLDVLRLVALYYFEQNNDPANPIPNPFPEEGNPKPDPTKPPPANTPTVPPPFGSQFPPNLPGGIPGGIGYGGGGLSNGLGGLNGGQGAYYLPFQWGDESVFIIPESVGSVVSETDSELLEYFASEVQKEQFDLQKEALDIFRSRSVSQVADTNAKRLMGFEPNMEVGEPAHWNDGHAKRRKCETETGFNARTSLWWKN